MGAALSLEALRQARPHYHRTTGRDRGAIRHGLSNARVEAINTQIRLIARRAFGFHSPQALISLAMLKLGGLCPPLPGRVTVA